MADAFDNPAQAPSYDILTSHVDKTFVFDTVSGVFTSDAKAVFSYGGEVVQSYSVGSGIVITESNKKLTVTLQGEDFAGYPDHILEGEFTLFSAGDRDVIMDLHVKDTNL